MTGRPPKCIKCNVTHQDRVMVDVTEMNAEAIDFKFTSDHTAHNKLNPRLRITVSHAFIRILRLYKLKQAGLSGCGIVIWSEVKFDIKDEIGKKFVKKCIRHNRLQAPRKHQLQFNPIDSTTTLNQYLPTDPPEDLEQQNEPSFKMKMKMKLMKMMRKTSNEYIDQRMLQ